MLARLLRERERGGPHGTVPMGVCLAAAAQRKRVVFEAWRSVFLGRLTEHAVLTGHFEVVLTQVIGELLMHQDGHEEGEA